MSVMTITVYVFVFSQNWRSELNMRSSGPSNWLLDNYAIEKPLIFEQSQQYKKKTIDSIYTECQ